MQKPEVPVDKTICSDVINAHIENDQKSRAHDAKTSWWKHDPTLTTFFTTVSASLVSAMITYPAQMMKTEWQQTALSKWTNASHMETIPFHSGKIDKNQWRVHATIRPLLRLTLNELALACLGSGAPKFYDEVLAGTMAGLTQAAIICPLEAYLATKQMNTETRVMEEKLQKRWWSPNWINIMEVSPRERLVRAYKGVGGMAAREVIFNASFFPMFHWFQKEGCHPITSGVIAGSLCAQLVTPLDVWSTYMTHSRITWHWWTGRKLQAPPLQLLFRGISLQALVFGPCFGLVAAVYQLS